MARLMQKKLALVLCLVAAWQLSRAAFAAPMGFKDSTMLMVDASPNWREVSANYALTSKDAIGVQKLSMRSDDKQRSRDSASLTYTRLAKRWNLPHAQANVWLFANAGHITGNDFAGTRTLLSPGVQVDYETTRVYAAATAKLIRASSAAAGVATGSGLMETALRHDELALRTGFSFTDADYDEPQPWLIVEARRMKNLSDATEITPMLRVIHNRYFVEAGYSNQKQLRFNVMFNF
jgi:hypothetical protein